MQSLTLHQKIFLHWVRVRIPTNGVMPKYIDDVLQNGKYGKNQMNRLNELGKYYQFKYNANTAAEKYYNEVLKGKTFNVRYDTVVYYFGELKDGNCDIYWYRKERVSMSYPLKTIINFLSNGEWIIIK